MGRPRPCDRSDFVATPMESGLRANVSTLIMAGRISSVRGDLVEPLRRVFGLLSFVVRSSNHGAGYLTGLVALRNLHDALHNNGGVTRKRAHARCGPAMAAPVAEEGDE